MSTRETQRTEEITIEEEEIAFFYSIGKAISEWGYVENVLGYLVLNCFEKKDNEDLTHSVTSVGFFSIETFKAKMDFAEAVVKRKFINHQSDWSKLVKRVRKSSGARNKLAHWAKQTYRENIPGRRFMLTPWVFSRKKKSKHPQPPDGSQGLRDIHKMRLEFISLAMSLRNFEARVLGHTEPFPKSHEQPTRPLSIGKLRVQIPEGLASQLASSEKRP